MMKDKEETKNYPERKQGDLNSHLKWVEHTVKSWPKWKQEIFETNKSTSVDKNKSTAMTFK